MLITQTSTSSHSVLSVCDVIILASGGIGMEKKEGVFMTIL